MRRGFREPQLQAPQRPMIELLQETGVGVFAGELKKPMRETIRELELVGGVKGAAATAAKRYETQFNVPEDDNQDRIIIGRDLVAVVDGFGGGENGRDAAQVLAEELLRVSSGVSLERATQGAIAQYNTSPEKFKENDGACFATCRVLEKTSTGQWVELSHLGDCRVIVLDETGNVIEESEDDSFVNQRLKTGELTESAALVSHDRNRVSKYVAEAYHGVKITPRMCFVPNGGRVILVTDGVMDNFSTVELAREVHGKTAREAITHVDQLIDQRVAWLEDYLADKSGEKTHLIDQLIEEQWEPADPDRQKPENCFPDGFQALPQRDDRGMIILDL
jgi:serine/threonine protein phosphatase PrpC